MTVEFSKEIKTRLTVFKMNQKKNHKRVAKWRIEQGSEVEYQEALFKVIYVLNIKSVLAKPLSGGEARVLLIKDLKIPKDELKTARESSGSGIIDGVDIHSVSDGDWKEMERRRNFVQQLLNIEKPTRKDAKKIAKKARCSIATLYRWRKDFIAVGKSSILLPNRRPGGKGKSRLIPRVEEIMKLVIETFYLVLERPSIKATAEEIERLCRKENLKAPSENTVKNRISLIDERRKLAARYGQSAARRKEATRGQFPEPLAPLEVVQIDHTVVNVIVVDTISRMAYTRPHITVAIDVYSRMILGFYLTFDDPSILSVGLCLHHAILPKDRWLEERNIDFSWDAWGIMKKIHADNAGEFHAEDIKRACEEYGIDIEWRPLGKPEYGAHIESMIRTFSEMIKAIPGTTFANSQEKGNYDSEGRAIYTIEELERRIAIDIIGKYHHEIHSSLGMAPITKFELGILGDEEYLGIGIPEIVTDEEKLRLDFLPMIKRTIQDYGVAVDEIRYDDAILNIFRGARDPKNRRLAREFIFKRDPANINKLFFYHPDLQQYFPIPYRNRSRPDMSLWELRRVRNYLRSKNINRIDNEDIIFKAHDEIREMDKNAKHLTKQAKKEVERKIRLEKRERSKTKSQTYEKPSNKIISEQAPDYSEKDNQTSSLFSSKPQDGWLDDDAEFEGFGSERV